MHSCFPIIVAAIFILVLTQVHIFAIVSHAHIKILAIVRVQLYDDAGRKEGTWLTVQSISTAFPINFLNALR